ncbi:hypothetical protein PVAP13_8KG061184 [Panicum virgatum]|uniref:Uncharacterized protein n=1 Tax=Panicum virgatum TaxID=38727 RepID=A0A8T0PDQ4_PANVG|nr:hypothetical protein PVAP13_8KG061184 [Panicum virgatum]
MAGVLDALSSYVQNMLTEMARDEVQMLLGVSGEIEKMDIKLKDLKNFLRDADKRSIADESVQAWVLELREAMYDATNIIDICQLKAMEQGPSHDVGCFNPVLNFINLNLYEDRSRRVASSGPGSRETSGELDESSLVGENIEEDTRNLEKILTTTELSKCENNEILVFAIVGVGGIGKTTLAKKIFNHDIIQQEFAKKIWLSVNHDFSETDLLRRAIIEAGGDHQSVGNTRGALERALKKVLNGQKTLLVMDDVWKHQVWEDVLQTPLVSAALAHGSHVLVTTRHDTVARGMMAVKPYHHVQKLQPKDAWLLLKKKVVGNQNDEAQIELLKDIGMEIITKCDCLPLAVKVMGGLLRQKTARRRDWENVLNDSIWSVSQMHEELNYAIYLSYEGLHPCLKPCFLYYSLIPKSTCVSVDDIVGMWISEGFLIQRNLIEPYGMTIDQTICNMHDVVRSFAQYVARSEALVAQSSETDISDKLNSQKFIRLSLVTRGSESNEVEWCTLQARTSLRTLIIDGGIKLKPGDSLVAFSNLRTLSVEGGEFDALAESLYQLKHLRYLSLDCTKTSNIKQIPRGFYCLTNLRKLYGFPAHMDGDWCSLEELGPLSHLIVLDISDLENVASSSFATKARLGEKVQLSSLTLGCKSRLGEDSQEREQQQIEGVLDELRPPCCLETLVLDGYFGHQFPKWLMSTAVAPLESLRNLTVKDLTCCTELPHGLCRLPCLELLQIVKAPAVKHVGLNLYSQTIVATTIRMQGGMIEWEEWEWEEQVKAMPLLEELTLIMCKLRCMPPGLTFHARALKKLYIYDVKHIISLENFTSVVHLDLSGNTDLMRISNLPKLQKRIIVECPNMKVLEDVPALQELLLKDYDMETLPVYMWHVKPRHIQIDCSLSLLTSIAAGRSRQFRQIHEVKAYADDEAKGISRKWYVVYTRDPFNYRTNISRSAVIQGKLVRTCPIEDERPVGQHAPADKRVPLCHRFRCNAYRHLCPWLLGSCLHCSEALRLASKSNQWIEAAGRRASRYCGTRYWRLQQQKEASSRVL